MLFYVPFVQHYTDGIATMKAPEKAKQKFLDLKEDYIKNNMKKIYKLQVQLMQSSLLMHGRSGGYLGLDPAANSFHRIGKHLHNHNNNSSQIYHLKWNKY